MNRTHLKKLAVALTLIFFVFSLIPATVFAANIQWNLEGWRIDQVKWIKGNQWQYYEDDWAPMRLRSEGFNVEGAPASIAVQHDYMDADGAIGFDDAGDWFIGPIVDNLVPAFDADGTPIIPVWYQEGVHFTVSDPDVIPVSNGFMLEYTLSPLGDLLEDLEGRVDWAMYWRVHLSRSGGTDHQTGATIPTDGGSAYWNGASLHTHTSVTGNQDVPIALPPTGGDPSVSIDKTGPSLSKIGDEVTYTYTVTNTGDVTIMLVSIIDDQIGTIEENGDEGGLSDYLLPGDSEFIQVPWTIPNGAADPYVNVVTANYLYDGEPVMDSEDLDPQDSHSINLFQPAISLTKVANKSEALVGETIHYTITITNNSSADSPNLVGYLNDAMLGITDMPVNLAAEAAPMVVERDHVVTAQDPDPLDNTASVETNPVDFPNDIDDEDSVSVDILKPAIEIDKSGTTLSKIGDPVRYTFYIENTGDVPLDRVSVEDDKLGDLTSQFPASLAVGADATVHVDMNVPQTEDDPIENTVTAIYRYTPKGVDGNATDTDSHSLNLFQPAISLTKEANKAEAMVGETIHYTITITNNSSSDAPNLVGFLNDAMLGIVDMPVDLAAGADPMVVERDHIVTAQDADPLENTASVETNPDGFTNDIDDEDSVSVDIVHPAVSITKSGTELSKIGDPVTYSFEIENTGDVELTRVSVIDDKLGTLTSQFPSTLAVGAKTTVTVNTTVPATTEDPIVNTVTAIYQYAPKSTAGNVSDTDTHSLNLFVPGITLEKIGDKETVIVGETIHYTITITNTSSLDSPNLVGFLNDAMLGIVNMPVDLAAGAAPLVVERDYIVQDGDPNPLVNTARVETNPVGFTNEINAEDSWSVTVRKAETAWGYSRTPALNNDFLNDPLFTASRFSNWGWSIGPINLMQDGTMTLDLLAAAGTTRIGKTKYSNAANGIDVGDVIITWTGYHVTAEYIVTAPYELRDIHLWVGTTPLPVVTSGKKTVYTNAPGQFNWTGTIDENHCLLDLGTMTDHEIYIAAHAVVLMPVE